MLILRLERFITMIYHFSASEYQQRLRGPRIGIWFHNLLEAIHKRRRPIFPILWPPSLPPLLFFIAFGLISPKGDVVYEALKPCPPNTHNTTTTREAPNLHICNFEKRLELGFFSAETGRLSKPSTLYLHKQGTYFHRFSKNFGTSKTTSALPKIRYLFSSPFIGSEGVPPPSPYEETSFMDGP